MTRAKLIEQIFKKKNFLCVGLDPDLTKIPKHLHSSEDVIFEFNKAIIKATAEHCVAFKPNSAFYEAYGAKGWMSLEKTVKFIRDNYPDHFVIMDAKRGDIGNTSGMYAKALLQEMNCDAVTVAPYMGSDSVKPFLSIKDKWVVLLALTSNEGAFDFQTAELKSGEKVFEKVLQVSSAWGSKDNMMYVVGATKAEMLKEIRTIVPDHFLLVPGVGAQGGSLEDVCKYGMTKECGLLINASRSILYASSDATFAEAALAEAGSIHSQMKKFFN